MSDDLKDTFDGYLMFDFSNFHGLMAQSFENESIDVPRVERIPKRKQHNIPGPYLDTPLMDLEKNGDVSEGIQYGLDDDEVPELNFDEDCLSHFNYSTSGFNLLANLEFEPDDDAYDNVLNSQELTNQRGSRRRQKNSIFSPTLQFEENVDQKIKMINLQNIDTLNQERQLDEFYRFLRQLDFLNFSNIKQNEDLIRVEELLQLVEIRILFEKMNDQFTKRCEQSHSISFTSKLHFFQLQLDHFVSLVNFIVDNGTTQQKVQRENVVKDHTLTLSVVFFKGMEIIEQFKMLQFQKSMVDRRRKIRNARLQIKSLSKAVYLLMEAQCNFVNKLRYINQHSGISNSQQVSNTVDFDKMDFHSKYCYGKELFFRDYKRESQRIILRGLDQYLMKNIQTDNIMPRRVSDFNRNKSNAYLEFDSTHNEENIYQNKK